MTRAIILVLFAVACAGCASTSYVYQPAPPPASSTTSTDLLVDGSDGAADLQAYQRCAHGAQSAEVVRNAGDVALTVMTLSLVSAHTVEITCNATAPHGFYLDGTDSALVLLPEMSTSAHVADIL